jgi:hypothetical protein
MILMLQTDVPVASLASSCMQQLKQEFNSSSVAAAPQYHNTESQQQQSGGSRAAAALTICLPAPATLPDASSRTGPSPVAVVLMTCRGWGDLPTAAAAAAQCNSRRRLQQQQQKQQQMQQQLHASIC